MKTAIGILSVISILCIFMHEFDAFHRGEWKMFGFLKSFREETRFRIFLFAHIPVTLFLFYYLWTVITHRNFTLWLIMNLFAVAHLLLHLFAVRWETNVFTSRISFAFMFAWALCGLGNLCLWSYY